MTLRKGSDARVSQTHHRARRARFIAQLAPNSVAVFVSNPERTRSNDTEYKYRQSSDVLYLTGFNEPETVVVLSNIQGQPQFTMFVRPRDKAMETWNGRRKGVDGARSEFHADAAFTVDKFAEVLKDMLKAASHVYYKFERNEHFDEKFRGVWKNRQKTLLNPEDILHELRLFKTPEEIALMARSAEISAEGHRAAMLVSPVSSFEYELQAKLEEAFTRNGASAPAYGSIVAAGANACILHYTENDAPVRDGDLVLIDAACEYQGYAADITRTFPANGKFTKPQREIYEIVLKAQLAAIDKARKGTPLADVHLAAQVVLAQGLVRLGVLPKSALLGKYLEKFGKGKYAGKKAKLHLSHLYMHGTSHWLGMDVHDVGKYNSGDGSRASGKERPLQPGMVITVEPGLYFDPEDTRIPERYRGIGVRIEDDVVITDDGNLILTGGVPKTVADIEALMSRRSRKARR